MHNVTPQHYKTEGQKQEIELSILENSVKAISRIQKIDARLFPLLTLNHLSKVSGISYGYLRNVITRNFAPYKTFMMKKRVDGRNRRRLICVPADKLMTCQKWISQNILKYGAVHQGSFAYHPQSTLGKTLNYHY